MKINYVYNDKGIAEYVVIPADVWVRVQKYLKKTQPKTELKDEQVKKKFNPRDFKGILSPLNLDIEQELLNMKNAWKKNI
jgi:hypothetical protein